MIGRNFIVKSAEKFLNTMKKVRLKIPSA